MFISSDQEERDSVAAYRTTLEVLGIVLATAIQGQIVGGTSSCSTEPDVLSNGTLPVFNVTSTSLDEMKQAYLTASGVIACIHFLCAACLIFGVKEQKEPSAPAAATAVSQSQPPTPASSESAPPLSHEDEESSAPAAATDTPQTQPPTPAPPEPATPPPHEDEESGRKKTELLTFRQGLGAIMRHGPYMKLVFGFLFTSLAFMLLQGNFVLFITYALGHRKDYQNILLVIMLSGMVATPCWQWFLVQCGKKKAVYGIVLAIPCMIVIVFAESSLIISYLVSVLAGGIMAAALFLPWSMLPDVVDDFKVNNPNVQGHEALMYSFYAFFLKFASGISQGLSTLSLQFAGYETGKCVQPEAVSVTLKVLVSAVPAVLIVVGLVILMTYPIDQEWRCRNQENLLRMQSSKTDPRLGSSEVGSQVQIEPLANPEDEDKTN